MGGSGRKQTLKLPCLPQTPPPFQGQLLPLGIPGWPSRALSVGLKGLLFHVVQVWNSPGAEASARPGQTSCSETAALTLLRTTSAPSWPWGFFWKPGLQGKKGRRGCLGRISGAWESPSFCQETPASFQKRSVPKAQYPTIKTCLPH